ncbi:uncharacterized protein LOC106654854 [Trichogramma pretiosum]|uniref:uncharacterized protein LOC106654854 n=1 Tax=Trichogramma pretiosum TaxID=7493 RepID=UPI0006C9CAA6|nr:uncharacterized protein LOC106654854 [Trichogramma pretiosum]
MTDSKMASIDLDEKINRMRLKNEEIKRRYEEVEADKKRAAKANALVNLVPSKDWPIRREPPEFSESHDASTKLPYHGRDTVRPLYPSVQDRLQRNAKYGQGDGPPPDPKYNFLADTERETQLISFENKIDEDKNTFINKAQRGVPQKRERGPAASTRSGGNSQSHFKDGRTTNVFHSRDDRPDYEAWRAERNKIDEARINRQKTAEGNWRREWDNEKSNVEKEFTKKVEYNRNNSNTYERKNNYHDGDYSHKGYGGSRVFHGSQRSSEHQDYNRRSQANNEFRRTTSDRKDTKNEWSDDSSQGSQCKGSLMSVKVNAPSIAGTGRVGPRQKSRVTYSSQQDADASFETNSYSKPKSFDYRNGREFGNPNKVELRSTEFTSSLKNTSTALPQKVETDQKEFRKHTYSQQRPRPIRNLNSEKIDSLDLSENKISIQKGQLNVTQNVNDDWDVEMNPKSSESIEMPVGLIISNSNLKKEDTTPHLDIDTISKTMIFENNSVPSMNSSEILVNNSNVNVDKNLHIQQLVMDNENSLNTFETIATFEDKSVKIPDNIGILELQPADISEIIRYHQNTFETIETVAVKSDEIVDSVLPYENESIKTVNAVETFEVKPADNSKPFGTFRVEPTEISERIETFDVKTTQKSENIETFDVKSEEVADSVEPLLDCSVKIADTIRNFEVEPTEISGTIETFEVQSVDIAKTVESSEDTSVETADTVGIFKNESEELSQQILQSQENLLKNLVDKLAEIPLPSIDTNQLENDLMRHDELFNKNSEEKVITDNFEDDKIKVNVNLLLIDDDGQLETPIIPQSSELKENITSEDSCVDNQNLDAPEISKDTEENVLISLQSESHEHNIDDLDYEAIVTEDMDVNLLLIDDDNGQLETPIIPQNSTLIENITSEDSSMDNQNLDASKTLKVTEENALISKESDSHQHGSGDLDNEAIITEDIDCEDQSFVDADEDFVDAIDETYDFENSNTDVFDSPQKSFYDANSTSEKINAADELESSNNQTFDEFSSEFKETIEITKEPNDKIDTICDNSSATINEPPTTALKDILDIICDEQTISDLDNTFNEIRNLGSNLNDKNAVKLQLDELVKVSENIVSSIAEEKVFLNETQENPSIKLDENFVSVQAENNVATSLVLTGTEDNVASIKAEENITSLEVKENVLVESKEEFFIETKDIISPIEVGENIPSIEVKKSIASLKLNENINAELDKDVLSDRYQEKVPIETEKNVPIENKNIPIEAEVSSTELEENNSIEKIEGN